MISNPDLKCVYEVHLNWNHKRHREIAKTLIKLTRADLKTGRECLA
jgi:hypothetical protein